MSDPSLELNIDWNINGKKIDFEQEPRFVKQSDNSLSITKTTELDSGVYTCVAHTNLDETTKAATLIVQGKLGDIKCIKRKARKDWEKNTHSSILFLDVPNAPQLLDVECHDKDASITWRPMGDNRAPILGYTIQHNTSFTPDTWEDSLTNFPPTSTQANVGNRFDLSMIRIEGIALLIITIKLSSFIDIDQYESVGQLHLPCHCS